MNNQFHEKGLNNWAITKPISIVAHIKLTRKLPSLLVYSCNSLQYTHLTPYGIPEFKVVLSFPINKSPKNVLRN